MTVARPENGDPWSDSTHRDPNHIDGDPRFPYIHADGRVEPPQPGDLDPAWVAATGLATGVWVEPVSDPPAHALAFNDAGWVVGARGMWFTQSTATHSCVAGVVVDGAPVPIKVMTPEHAAVLVELAQATAARPFLDPQAALEVFSPAGRFDPLPDDNPSVGRRCLVCGHDLRAGEAPTLVRLTGSTSPNDEGLTIEVQIAHERCVYGHLARVSR